MKKILFLIVIAAAFLFAAYKKPLLDDHKTKIYTAATGADTAVNNAILALPEWENLEFCDWVIFTATKDKEKHSMVSYGIVSYIKVTDPDWGRKTFAPKSE
jgi:hypothetical protein